MGGKRVCGQRTRDIHIRYLYAHERVTDGTIIVTYCPTKEMVSDYLSKPLRIPEEERRTKTRLYRAKQQRSRNTKTKRRRKELQPSKLRDLRN